MDFGSKYVYSGADASPYYSSVPRSNENAAHQPTSSSEAIYDPVYESINYQPHGPKEEDKYTQYAYISRQNTAKKPELKPKPPVTVNKDFLPSPEVEEDSAPKFPTGEPPKIPPRKYESMSSPTSPTIMTAQGPLYPSLTHLTNQTEVRPNLYRINSMPCQSLPSHKQKLESKAKPLMTVPKELLPQPAYNPYASANTNVISVKMNVLENKRMVTENNGANSCPNCKAIVQDKIGVCNFCKYCDISCSELFPKPIKNDDRTIIIQRNRIQGHVYTPLVVFCIDTSGSMCVTSQVQSSGSQYFISRLEGVKQAVIQQIEFLYRKNPCTEVALVSFADNVIVHGDGSINISFEDMQLYDTDFLLYHGQSITQPKPLSFCKQQLIKTIESLKERGGTALGPAMMLSVAMASNKRGSQVIVCTDGRANVGVGSLETEDEYAFCHFFYDETTEIALNCGIAVSILSIRGSDCRLVQLGKISDKTAGEVQIADVDDLTKEFASVVTNPLIATDVTMTIIGNSNISFIESDEKLKNVLTKKIGNVTRHTEVTIKYDIDGHEDEIQPMVPFQLQISYQTLGGDKCKRVITQLRPTSNDLMVVEREMNPIVVEHHAKTTAATLMLQGDFDNAAITTQAHKELINRVSKVRGNDKIYGEIKERINQLDSDILSMQYEKTGSGDSQSSESTPPALPPRIHQGQRSQSCLHLPLPDVPTHEPTRTKKKNKLKIANIGDDIAGKLYKYKKACSNKITALQQ